MGLRCAIVDGITLQFIRPWTCCYLTVAPVPGGSSNSASDGCSSSNCCGIVLTCICLDRSSTSRPVHEPRQVMEDSIEYDILVHTIFLYEGVHRSTRTVRRLTLGAA